MKRKSLDKRIISNLAQSIFINSLSFTSSMNIWRSLYEQLLILGNLIEKKWKRIFELQSYSGEVETFITF